MLKRQRTQLAVLQERAEELQNDLKKLGDELDLKIVKLKRRKDEDEATNLAAEAHAIAHAMYKVAEACGWLDNALEADTATRKVKGKKSGKLCPVGESLKKCRRKTADGYCLNPTLGAPDKCPAKEE